MASDTPGAVVDVVGTLDHTERVLDMDVVGVGTRRAMAAGSETFDARRSWVTWHRSKHSGEQLGSSSP